MIKQRHLSGKKIIFLKFEITVMSLQLWDRQLTGWNFDFLLAQKIHPDPCFPDFTFGVGIGMDLL